MFKSNRVAAVVTAALAGTLLTGATAAAVFADDAVANKMKSLDEYAELYPAQTEGWLRLSEDGSKSMGSMEANFSTVLDVAFGMDGVPLYCGSCHNADYAALTEELTEERMLQTDTAAGIDVEYMGCGVCHTSDLAAGVDDRTSFWKSFISEESWNACIAEDDQVCGQCHMLEPSSAYLLPEYAGTVDIYKYGATADGVFQAMYEAWEENPIEITDVMVANAFQVGATRIDEATGALILGDNNKPILETYQGGVHQSLGLTCTDCHMTAAVDEDGNAYTDHYACDPLKNEAALELCLTCHEAQGIEDADAMVAFVRDDMAKLAEAQQSFKADVAELQELLTEATASGDVDSQVLEEARWDYTRAVFYYQYQAQLTSEKADQGVTVAHNAASTYETLEKGQAFAREGIALLGA